MSRSWKRFLFVGSIVAAGCGSSEKPGAETNAVTFHEYKKIFAVDVQEGKPARSLVGYLDRRFTDEDPDGKYFVLDRTHKVRGFLLPGGQAFSYGSQEAPVSGAVASQSLGNTGFDNGVKKILSVGGTLEYEDLTSASVLPPTATATPKS